jgi:hypothetical protein
MANGVNRIINGKEVFVPFKTSDEVELKCQGLSNGIEPKKRGKNCTLFNLQPFFIFAS